MKLTAWGFIPARGGSKSISKKNLIRVSGRPLLDYVSLAARACGPTLQRIVGSTDDPQIAKRMRELVIEVDERPAHLATDTAPVAEVGREFLRRNADQGVPLPDVLVLLQPTSPFVLPEHAQLLLETMANDPESQSGQTIAPCPHNHHELNQRWHEKGRTGFVHLAQRTAAYNKQAKQSRWVFGNLVAARCDAILDGADFFATPSVAVPISFPYNLDVDGPSDVTLAEAVLRAGLVHLPHTQRVATEQKNR